jgi:hypothetical protein
VVNHAIRRRAPARGKQPRLNYLLGVCISSFSFDALTLLAIRAGLDLHVAISTAAAEAADRLPQMALQAGGI